MPGPWGPPPMMYLPCPPWAGWYGPWASPPMHFHPGWSGLAENFSHGGYYAGDGHYVYVGHQQDSRTLRQENWMVQKPKLDGPVSLKAAAVPEQRSKQEVSKDRSSTNQPGSSQGQTGSGSVSSANGEVKPNVERNSEGVAVEQDRVPEVKAETKTEARTCSRWPPNWTVQLPKPDHPVSSTPR
jgi:hypothetical protein